MAETDDHAAASQPLVRLEGISKRFGAVTAVDELTLDIARGEFFCLLGPSGCGKSTVMRMIAGFERPEAGRILLDGVDITDMPPHRRPVNMMFQSYALFPHLSVGDNIAFGLKQDGLPRPEIAVRVAEMLELVQLTGFETRRPDQLSGGQRQRVALARALAKRPRLLLLDEPLGALDRRLREETQFELMALHERLGATFVVVTHDQDEAMTMADRIAVMERGRIAQIGTPRAIYETPASRAVASFVGDVNLFEGIAEPAGEGMLRVRVPDVDAAFRVASALAVSSGTPVALALRPERIVLSGEGDGSGPNPMTGRVDEIGYLGDRTVVIVTVTGGRQVKVTRANGAADGVVPARGETVTLNFSPAAGVVLTR